MLGGRTSFVGVVGTVSKVSRGLDVDSIHS